MLKTFVFLATIWTQDGPVIFELDTGLTGADCVARMERGLTVADVAAMASGAPVQGEGHIPADFSSLEIATAVLSCEFDWK
jgi:hypothetical protein